MSERNLRCVVLLPEGPFFARLFEEILAPILAEGGYLPGLMQRISPAPVPAFHLIEQIDQCDMLLADLSESTPEICFAAGYAIAFGKHLCLISSIPQLASPLSFEPPGTIFYPVTALPSDFHKLQQTIARQLAAYPAALGEIHATAQQQQVEMSVSASENASTKNLLPSSREDESMSIPSTDDDLVSYEVLALKLIDLKASEDGLSPRDLGMQMRDNQSAHLTSHAMNSLKRRGFIERRLVNVTEGIETFLSDNLFLTLLGEQWLNRNERRSIHSSRSDAGSLTFQSL